MTRLGESVVRARPLLAGGLSCDTVPPVDGSHARHGVLIVGDLTAKIGGQSARSVQPAISADRGGHRHLTQGRAHGGPDPHLVAAAAVNALLHREGVG